MNVGSFTVKSLLGEGAFGRTYRGEHIILGTGLPVVVKEEKTGQEPYITMFRDEALMLAKLRHFGLPTLLDYQENLPGCGNLIIMSDITGIPLDKDIDKNGPLADEHLFWVADRILEPADYLHERWNIVHSDLKPANVLVNYPLHEGVIIDLGLATLKPDARTHAKGGTPGYLPPEFALGYPPIPQSDIYSIGKILIFLATGSDEMVQRGECPADMNVKLAECVGRMIQRDPRQRPGSAAEVQAELHRLRQSIFGRTTCNEMIKRRNQR